MKKSFIKILMVVLVSTLMISITCLCGCIGFNDFLSSFKDYSQNKDVNNYVTVLVRGDDGVSLPVGVRKTVKRGEDCTFTFSVNDGFSYVDNTKDCEVVFEDGVYVLYVKDCKSSMTIDIVTLENSKFYNVSYKYNQDSGDVEHVSGQLHSAYAPEITLKATPKQGYVFVGFSKNGYLHDGGTLLSENTLYTFTPDKIDYKVYANFKSVQENSYTITYFANGGRLENSEEISFSITKPYNNLFMLQYTMHDNNDLFKFVREGYTLVGYSTSPSNDYDTYESANDIEGFSNLGGICEVDRTYNVLHLYCVWAKTTGDSYFEYEDCVYSDLYIQGQSGANKTYSGIRITDYVGDLETIVIPEKIDNKPVIGIGTNAFLKSGGQAKKLVVPKSVLKIEPNACDGLTNLKELVFTNATQKVDDNSFVSSLKTVVVNSQRYPAMGGQIEALYSFKYQRIRYNYSMNKKQLIVLSGSSSFYGLNSPMLKKLLNEEYEIVNYGTNAGACILVYFTALSNYLNKNDVVVYAPEYTMDNTNGRNIITDKNFSANEQAYDIFREIDLSKFTNFFSGWTEYQKKAMPCKISIYQQEVHLKNSYINVFGDMLGDRANNKSDSSTNGAFRNDYLKWNNVANRLNEVAQKIMNKGAYVLYSFAPINREIFNSGYETNCDKFAQNASNLLVFPVISNPKTYLFEEQYMYDTPYHPTYYGANIRTVELAFDIKRYFEVKDKQEDSYMLYAERDTYNSTTYPEDFFDFE